MAKIEQSYTSHNVHVSLVYKITHLILQTLTLISNGYDKKILCIFGYPCVITTKDHVSNFINPNLNIQWLGSNNLTHPRLPMCHHYKRSHIQFYKP
jgi:hypothetical protein